VAIAFAALTLGGVVLVVIGWMGWAGRLPRNHIAGIRTPYTMRSDANWYATHRYAGPLYVVWGALLAVVGVLASVLTVVGWLPTGPATAVSLALTVLALGGVIAGWLYGTRRARAELAATSEG